MPLEGFNAEEFVAHVRLAGLEAALLDVFERFDFSFEGAYIDKPYHMLDLASLNMPMCKGHCWSVREGTDADTGVRCWSLRLQDTVVGKEVSRVHVSKFGALLVAPTESATMWRRL